MRQKLTTAELNVLSFPAPTSVMVLNFATYLIVILAKVTTNKIIVQRCDCI